MDANKLKFACMNRTVIGGAACPLAMIQKFDEDYGVRVIQGWGMTEMSPLGTASTLKAKHLNLPAPERWAVQARQGHGIFGVDMKIVDPDGAELPWDGVAAGDVLVRGPWIVDQYFKSEGGNPQKMPMDVTGSQLAMWQKLMPMATCKSLTAART
jgi:3-(methylthio)propionyl---CoA ligase